MKSVISAHCPFASIVGDLFSAREVKPPRWVPFHWVEIDSGRSYHYGLSIFLSPISPSFFLYLLKFFFSISSFFSLSLTVSLPSLSRSFSISLFLSLAVVCLSILPLSFSTFLYFLFPYLSLSPSFSDCRSPPPSPPLSLYLFPPTVNNIYPDKNNKPVTRNLDPDSFSFTSAPTSSIQLFQSPGP